MNKRIERMIPVAYSAVSDNLVSDQSAISKQYNGYISSFGASVIQSGMLLALIFYHQSDANSEQDRGALMKAIRQVVISEGHNMAQNMNLLDYFRTMEEERSKQKRLTQCILDAATAIKLVIRTFQLIDDGNN